MKIIELIWRDPAGNIMSEKLEQDKFSVITEPGWLVLKGEPAPGEQRGPTIRIIPSEKVCLVQFAEVADKPRIVRPDEVLQPKFQPS